MDAIEEVYRVGTLFEGPPTDSLAWGGGWQFTLWSALLENARLDFGSGYAIRFLSTSAPLNRNGGVLAELAGWQAPKSKCPTVWI